MSNLGYAIYPGGGTRAIDYPNPKLRGFKINGVRPHTIILFTDDPEYYKSALMKVPPITGKVYKATPL